MRTFVAEAGGTLAVGQPPARVWRRGAGSS